MSEGNAEAGVTVEGNSTWYVGDTTTETAASSAVQSTENDPTIADGKTDVVDTEQKEDVDNITAGNGDVARAENSEERISQVEPMKVDSSAETSNESSKPEENKDEEKNDDGSGNPTEGAVKKKISPRDFPKNHQCPQCPKRFSHPNSLTQHIATHMAVKTYQCHMCEKGFPHPNSLKQHLASHQAAKIYHCSYCDKTFDHPNGVKQHEKSHTDVRPYQCGLCQKAFFHANNLQQHVAMHHSDGEPKPWRKRKTDDGQGILGSAPGGGQGILGSAPSESSYFSSNTSSNTTQNPRGGAIKKAKLDGDVSNGSNEYPCHICEKVFNHPNCLQQHIDTHTKANDYPCTLCDKSFAHPNNLAQHMQKHTGIPWQQGVSDVEKKAKNKLPQQQQPADQDDGGFWGPPGLQDQPYMQDYGYSGEEPPPPGEEPPPPGAYDDPYGPAGYYGDSAQQPPASSRSAAAPNLEQPPQFGFNQSQQQQQHQPQQQQRNRSRSSKRGGAINPNAANTDPALTCQICSKVFSHPNCLRQHLDTHAAAKQYPCSMCEKSFSHPNCLKQHEMQHTGEKAAFPCNACGKNFLMEKSFNKHLRTCSGTRGGHFS